MMNTGIQTEEQYKTLFLKKCPRPIKIRDDDSDDNLFKDCLLEQWQPLIQEVLDELLINPPKINQLVKGRKGEKTFNKEKTDELITTTETLVKRVLRKTEEGLEFYKEGKNTTVKAMTFCVLGCQLLQIAKEKWNLSNIKAKLINKTLVHYYLEGATTISNATMNDYEGLILNREKKKEKIVLPITPEVVEEKKVLEIDLTDMSPLLFPRDKLRKLTLFDVQNYFLEGEEELTDALQKICTNKEVENKRCITCDESHEFYSLASRKLIHLFIYNNELFDTINLTTDCLLEEQIDVTKLRRRLELLLRQEVGQWELTQEEKNKFVLCTVCHLIRHFRLLGQLDLVDSIKVFFEFKGEIYNLSEVELDSEKEQVMSDLELSKPQVIGKVQPKEIVVTQLPKQDQQSESLQFDKNKLDLLKSQLEEIANNTDLDILTPIEIIEYKRKAKELLNPEELEERLEPDDSWIDVFLANSHDKELQPFLAKEALIRLEEEEKKAKAFKDSSLISIEQLKLNKQQCSKCRETVDFAICLERVEVVSEEIIKGNKATEKLWTDREDLRPCIANKLSEK